MVRLFKILFIISALFSLSVSAEEDNYIDFAFYGEFLQKPQEERKEFLSQTINESGTNLIRIYENGDYFNMPIQALMVIQNHQEEAAWLVETDQVEAFELFEHKNNQSSDMVLAIEMGRLEYISRVIGEVENINKEFKFNGELGFNLLMVASQKVSPYSYNIAQILLNEGINLLNASANGMTALSIAQRLENSYVITAIRDYNNQESNNISENLMENSHRSSRIILEENRILNNFSGGLLEEIIEEETYHEDLYYLIMRGYSKAALRLIEEVSDRGLFNVNYKDEKGISFLMATSYSPISGGDVEVASKLIELGADVNYIINDIAATEGEVAISNDAYKVLFSLIQGGFNPFESTSSSKGVDLMVLSLVNEPVAINSFNLLNLMLEEIKE